ncbi:MAG: hypothetical protein CXZ00_02675 [Acidobacteria bacterium]|nr:MAG: hypothetical protein CXZ00_02675 [Acidobacteriota bacterium]
MVLAGSLAASTRVVLELFLVSPSVNQSVRYGRRTANLTNKSGDPDTVARQLLTGVCAHSILHSTSWRWERNGTLVLTYLAYSEDSHCTDAEPQEISMSALLPPQSTNPEKPRPAEIREQDVLAHGLRHLTFLMRYSPDDRIRKAVSPAGLQFFQALCGQLAGRYDTAKEFADCTSTLGIK